MRFRGRTASEKPLATRATTADHVLQLKEGEVPLKAEALLGTRSKSSNRGPPNLHTRQPTTYTPPLPPVSLHEDKSFGKSSDAQDWSRDTQQSLWNTMPSSERRGPRLQMWPNTEKYNRSATDLLQAEVYQPNQRPAKPARKTSSNGLQEYYDPSKQPLSVSQQTSDSALRDQGLRRGSPMMHEVKSEPNVGRRPLKSAMKRNQESERPGMPRTRTASSDKEKKSRRIDLSHFFSQPRSASHNLLSPNDVSRSPSALSDGSSFFPPETVQVQLKRPSANAPYETQKSLKPPSNEPRYTTRPKIFEADVFDHTKTNVRRPPKGTQNWFDAFDISSDEEEQPQSTMPEPVQMEPVELPANEALPSTFSPWAMKVEEEQHQQHRMPPYSNGRPTHDQWAIKPESDQPAVHRNASMDPIEDNLLAIGAAKERMQERMKMTQQRKMSVDSATNASAVSSQQGSRKPPSRLSRSQLTSESVLSLSDSEGDEKEVLPSIRGSVDDASVMVRQASSIYVEKPVQAPRKLHTKRNPPRESTSTVNTTATAQTSGSIPIRLTKLIPLPDGGPLSPPQTREVYRPSADNGAHSYQDEGAAYALSRLEGQRYSKSEPARSRPTTKASQQTFDTSVTGDSGSSLPTDAAHMMAVTEEEMILLEMMRNKRAMMAKNSFTEGYQQAVKKEQEQLEMRRDSARQAAIKYLRQKEMREGENPSQGTKTQRNSRLTERVDRIMDGTEPLPQLDEDIRRKYSAIRKEDVDKALKMEKFLGEAKTPTAESFPEPPTRNVAADEEPQPPEKIELLLPKTYSPVPSTTGGASQNEGVEGEGACSDLGDEDIESHHHRIKEFLAASSNGAQAGKGKTLFPPPPPVATKRPGLGRKDKSNRMILSPSPVAEEEPIPADDTPHIPERSPNRPSPKADSFETKERRRSINGRRLSSHGLENDPLLETANRSSAMPAPLRQASRDNLLETTDKHDQQRQQLQHHQQQPAPYHPHPTFDFSPLEYNSTQQSVADSPSVTTSWTSPMAPSFASTQPSSSSATTDRHSQVLEGMNSCSDNEQQRGSSSVRGRSNGRRGGAWTPDTDLTSLSEENYHGESSNAPSTMSASGRGKRTASQQQQHQQKQQGSLNGTAASKTRRTPKLANVPSNASMNSRKGRGSQGSTYSAGEDVLAAWAELGGGTDALASRRRAK
ncbi:hypothetical protein KC338_g6714 [Hortaea werneckii]|nr:hypothetical protein KC338_g6714 [Hortaea werneckii]